MAEELNNERQLGIPVKVNRESFPLWQEAVKMYNGVLGEELIGIVADESGEPRPGDSVLQFGELYAVIQYSDQRVAFASLRHIYDAGTKAEIPDGLRAEHVKMAYRVAGMSQYIKARKAEGKEL